MKYDFDHVPDRNGTNSYKWDFREEVFPGHSDVIPMWVADTDFPCPKEITDAVQARAQHPIYGYSSLPSDTAETVAAWQQKRNGWKIDPSWVTYTGGVVPALSMAVRAFAKPGEGVMIMSPVYYPFRSTIENNHRALRDCKMKFDGKRWKIDFNQMEELAALPDTRLLILCSPHNPLCRVFEREELEKVAEICLKNDVLILSDEIHSDLVFPGSKHIPIASLGSEISQHTITATAPSKTFNIAGLQMSAIICENPEIREKFTEALGFEFIPSVFGIEGIQAAYGMPGCEEYLDQLLNYLWGNYETLDRKSKKNTPAIRVQRPEATYLMWLDCQDLGLSDQELYDFFVVEAGVGIEMGNVFGGDSAGYVRMNIGCTRATVEECCRRIAATYRRHGFPDR